MSSKATTIAATAFGNALEYYDVIIYGTFALTIAQEFFPHHDADTSLLIAFATFGVSFFFRPLGGLILGSFGDRRGRKAALLLTMSLMLLGTFMIAVTPPYADCRHPVVRDHRFHRLGGGRAGPPDPGFLCGRRVCQRDGIPRRAVEAAARILFELAICQSGVVDAGGRRGILTY